MMYSIPLFVAKYINDIKSFHNDLFFSINNVNNKAVKNWLKEDSEHMLIFCQYFMDSDSVIVDKDWRYMIKCPSNWTRYKETLFVRYVDENTEFVEKEYATIFTKQEAEEFMKSSNINWELAEIED